MVLEFVLCRVQYGGSLGFLFFFFSCKDLRVVVLLGASGEMCITGIITQCFEGNGRSHFPNRKSSVGVNLENFGRHTYGHLWCDNE
jgi:hypothetical protein